MMKNSKQKFSEYMQNISRSKSFGKFVLIVNTVKISQMKIDQVGKYFEKKITFLTLVF